MARLEILRLAENCGHCWWRKTACVMFCSWCVPDWNWRYLASFETSIARQKVPIPCKTADVEFARQPITVCGVFLGGFG